MILANLRISAKSVITLAVLAIALFAANAVAYFAVSKSLGKAQADLLSREDQVRNSKKIAERLDQSEQRYLGMESRLRTLESSVSKAAYIPTMLKQLENTGKSVNLQVRGVRPSVVQEAPANRTIPEEGEGSGDHTADVASKPVPPKPYDTLQIDIEVRGTYWNTMRFLQALTSFPKIVAVERINITPNAECFSSTGRGTGLSPSLTVRLNLSAFVFPEVNNTLATVSGISPGNKTADTIQPAAAAPPTSAQVGVKNGRCRNEAG
ncbi:MAG: type 4a pilus biogenesis protein PilO [Armatimonadota bacterium]|nr:type 4a pilus biogenesis protein PilO [Armatimonadota bacterium]